MLYDKSFPIESGKHLTIKLRYHAKFESIHPFRLFGLFKCFTGCYSLHHGLLHQRRITRLCHPLGLRLSHLDHCNKMGDYYSCYVSYELVLVVEYDYCCSHEY